MQASNQSSEAPASAAATDQTAPFSIQYSAMSRGEQEMIVNVTKEYPFAYATIMFGYIMPFVLVLTLVTNTLVVMVLAQRHMRTPTNIVLFTMAIVDLMTLLAPSPWYFYIYTLGYHDKFLYPPAACYAHYIMTDVIPVFFHTSSIWLALLLASQRYIYVCHPTLARTWCTVPRVKRAILVILAVALLHQISRFFDQTYSSVIVRYESGTHAACRNEIADWVHKLDIAFYYTTYFTFRILFVFIIPCAALITLNCLLFRALRRAEHKRTELLQTKFRPRPELTSVGAPSSAGHSKLLHRPVTVTPTSSCHKASMMFTLKSFRLHRARTDSRACIVERRSSSLRNSVLTPIHNAPRSLIQQQPANGSSHQCNQHQHQRQTTSESCSQASSSTKALGDSMHSERDAECAECAACQRCSAHEPRANSQCSSLAAGTTNDDVSSCLATQLASSSHQNDPNESSSTRDEEEEEDEVVGEGEGGDRDREDEELELEENLSLGNHESRSKESAKSAETERSKLSPSGSVESRLTCGCPASVKPALCGSRRPDCSDCCPRCPPACSRSEPCIKCHSHRTTAPPVATTRIPNSLSDYGKPANVQSSVGHSVAAMAKSATKVSPAPAQLGITETPSAQSLLTQQARPRGSRSLFSSQVAPPGASVSMRTMDSNRTTLMLIVVVTVFLIVEVPVAIVTIIHVVLNSFDAFKDVDFGYFNYIKLFTNFFIMISYSVNFTIYCSMSKKFRETFHDLFLCGKRVRRGRARRLMSQQQSQVNPPTTQNQLGFATSDLASFAGGHETSVLRYSPFRRTQQQAECEL